MARYTITIENDLDNAISLLAKENKVSKSKIINEAIKFYLENILNPKEDINERLDKIEKELNRYNSLLAKNTLYTIAMRQHLGNLHAKLRGTDEAKKIADITWKYAIEDLRKKLDDLLEEDND